MGAVILGRDGGWRPVRLVVAGLWAALFVGYGLSTWVRANDARDVLAHGRALQARVVAAGTAERVKGGGCSQVYSYAAEGFAPVTAESVLECDRVHRVGDLIPSHAAPGSPPRLLPDGVLRGRSQAPVWIFLLLGVAGVAAALLVDPARLIRPLEPPPPHDRDDPYA